MIVKRKHILISVIVLFVFTVGYLGFTKSAHDATTQKHVVTNNSENSQPSSDEAVFVSASENDYFSKARSDRDIVRSKALEILNETIDNENVSKETKVNAENKLLKIASDIDCEKRCENLLVAKGYGENIVFISDDSVTLTIKCNSLTSEDIAKINDIIFDQTKNNNIKIVEVN